MLHICVDTERLMGEDGAFIHTILFYLYYSQVASDRSLSNFESAEETFFENELVYDSFLFFLSSPDEKYLMML